MGHRLTQVATLYRDSVGNLEPKEYSIKAQCVAGSGKQEKVHTFAKMTLDLSHYASIDGTGGKELRIELQPQARLITLASTAIHA